MIWHYLYITAIPSNNYQTGDAGYLVLLLELLGQISGVLYSQPLPVTLLHVSHHVLRSFVARHEHDLEGFPCRGDQVRVEFCQDGREEPAGRTPVG